MVTDFHSHILPGIDDGSKHTQISIQMMEREMADGVNKIVLTPHFYAMKDSVDRFLDRRQSSYNRLTAAIAGRSDLPQLLTGAEVYYFPGMGKAEQLLQLCISGTDILMLEMPFAQWTEAMVQDVKDMIYRRHLSVIIVHIERYYRFQKKKEYWNEIFRLPVTAQLNAECFTGGFRERHFGIRYLKSGASALLGTDCHNLESRAPQLAKARTYIQKKLGQETLDRIDRLGSEILKHEKKN